MARYVRTETARQAVKGRESEIFQKSGANWIPGQKHHADCPYRDHGGKSDCRLDEKTGLIFCTCLPRPHSIFDHLSKMRGDDPQSKEAFERSKIEAVELLGRTDLIEGRDSPSGNGTPFVKTWHHGFKAERLLNPPANLRDDSLVRTYLGSRQGVAEADAAIPSSPCVGIRELDLMDGDKVAATLPCLVFAMVDETGTVTGAIRIYLSPDGRSKAVVLRPNGSAVNPKPVATGTLPGGAVLYGDPTTATHQVTCEGVETGGGIANAAAHRGDDGVLIACGGSAPYMRHVPIYGNVKSLHIAADRDEMPNEKGNISKAGEVAAGFVADKHVNRLPVHIALPGSPGSKTDWLDVLKDAGHNAVYDGIFDAPLHVGKDKSNCENQQDVADTNDDREKIAPEDMTATDVESIYPLPKMNSEQFRYDRTENGEWWIFRQKLEKEDGEWVETWDPITTPFSVTRRLVMLDSGDGISYALRLAIQGMSGEPHEIDMDRSLLAKTGASDLKSLMYRSGIRTENNGDNIAVKILKCANPSEEIKVITRPGWHRLNGFQAPIYVCPTGEIIGDEECLKLELTVNSRISKQSGKRGCVEEWMRIAELIPTLDNVPHWSFALMAGFGGVLIDLLGYDTCGFCWTGYTSRGKSTAQIIMASPWGNPISEAGTLNHSARTTTNAIEVIAQRSSGSVFCLDDLKHMKGDQLAAFVYMISGGTGRTRMKADTSLRTSYSWKTLVALSAEHTLQQAIEEGGGDWLPGISVRIPDINVSNVNNAVPAEHMIDVNKIKVNYGHAGPLFVRALMDNDMHTDTAELQSRIDKVIAQLSGDGNAEMRRAAIPFAVVACAGELAKAAGLLPDTLDVQKTVSWGWRQFQKNNETTGGDRLDDALDGFNAWVSRNWNLTIVKKDDPIPKREIDAWYDDEYVYIKKDTIKKAIAQTTTVNDFIAKLKEEDFLTPNGNRNVQKYTPGLNIGTCYWLKRPRITIDPDTREPLLDAQGLKIVSPGIGPSPEEVVEIEVERERRRREAEMAKRVVPMAQYGRRS